MQKRREYVRRKQEMNIARQQQRMNARREQALLQRRMRSPNAIIENGKLLPTKFNAIGDTASILGITFGIVGLISFGFMSLILWATNDGSAADTLVSSLFSIFTIISGGFLGLGINQRKLIDRAKRYARICGSKMYAKLSQLAASSGLSEKKVRKDVRNMLAKGFYPEGYMDEEGTTLMLSDEVYKDYASMVSRQREEEAEAIKARQEGRLTNEEQSELDQMVAEGMDAVKKLHELNDNIPGEVITKKLSTLEDLLKQMFNRVKQHPEQMDRMHKLMDYYLPTMLKLVEAYDEYDKVTAPGKEIIQAKEEIERTLDTINEAFVQLLNNLFQDSVWDVTSDAQVLTTMLTQEGLAQESALK